MFSRFKFVLVILLLTLVLVGVWLDRSWQTSQIEKLKTNVTRQINPFRFAIEQALIANLDVVRGVQSAVTVQPQLSLSQFEVFAPKLLSTSPLVEHLILKPAIGNTLVFPPFHQGDEKMLTVELTTEEQVGSYSSLWRSAFYDSAIGRLDVIAMYPIYLEANRTAQWGEVILLFNLDNMLEKAGLHNYIDEFLISLMVEKPSGPEFILGTPINQSDELVIIAFATPLGKWQIWAIPINGWRLPWQQVTLARFVFVLLSVVVLLLAWRIHHILERQYSAELESKRNELQLDLIIDTARIGMWDWSIDTGNLFVNEQWLKIIGYSKHEVTVATMDDWIGLTHPDDIKRIKRTLQSYWNSNDEIVRFETRLKHRNNDWVWVYGIAKDIEYNAHGAAIRMIGTLVDITEKKNKDLQLNESRLQLESFFNNINSLMCIIRLDGTISRVNQSFVELIGFEEQSLVGHSFYEFVDEDSLSNTKHKLQMLSSENMKVSFENCCLGASGNYINLLWTASSDVKRNKIYLSAMDITQRKQNEKEIETLSKVASQTNNAVIVTDIEGRIEWVNEAFGKVTGYEFSEVKGLKPGEFLQGTDTDLETVDVMRKALKNREPFKVEVINYHKNKQPYWVEIRCTPMFDEKGNVQGFMAIELDISKVKQSQLQLERQQQMLSAMSLQGKIGAWEVDLISGKVFWSEMTKQIHEVESTYEPKLETAIEFYKQGADRERIANIVEDAIANGTAWNEELVIVTAKGKELWVSATGQAELKNGKCIRLFGSFQDINERKQIEISNKSSAKYNESLAALTLNSAVLSGNLDEARNIIAEMLCYSLDVARASIWLFENGTSKLRCISLLDQNLREFSQDQILLQTDFPNYFSAMLSQSYVSADDAISHPLTKEFAEVYLKPLGITSMLDAVIPGGDGVIGVVCAEHVGEKRHWTQSEEAFVIALATIVGSIYASEQRHIAEKQLQSKNHELTQQMKLLSIIVSTQLDVIGSADLAPAFNKLLTELISLTQSDFGFIGEIHYSESDEPYVQTHAISNTSNDELIQIEQWADNTILNALVEQTLENLKPIIINSPSTDPRLKNSIKINSNLRSIMGLPIVRNNTAVAFICLANRLEGYDDQLVSWLEPITVTVGQVIESMRTSNLRDEALAELVHAKEAAEYGTRSKSNFLASMSHEIRTPMNGVLGMLSLLRQSELEHMQAHQVNLAYSSAEALLTIINDVLDFSKIEAGKLELEHISFNLSKLLASIVESNAIKAEEKGLEVILDVSEVENPFVIGDPGRLRQITTNLISNAIKFTEVGNVIIRASLIDKKNNHKELICSVKDSGIGIDKLTQSKLFNAFTQADSSTTRRFGGTGLGLAIVKQLTELMGGSVIVDSKENHGSEFVFKVLLEKDLNNNFWLEQLDKLSDASVLVVDDNVDTAKTISKQFAVWGLANMIAHDKTTALQLLSNKSDKESFDIVFIDHHLNGESGIELVQAIRKEPEFDPVKLILMTAIKDTVNAELFLEKGIDLFFPKPATSTELYEALVNTWLKESRLSHAPFEERSFLPESSDLSGVKVLLVEDNKVNQAVAKAMLKKYSVESDVANNGREAISMLQNMNHSTPYAAVFMDCQMPEIDGYEATSMIRKGYAGEEFVSIPIIALTANAIKGDEEKCLASGMNDYLSKPLTLEKLKLKLQQWKLVQ